MSEQSAGTEHGVIYVTDQDAPSVELSLQRLAFRAECIDQTLREMLRTLREMARAVEKGR